MTRIKNISKEKYKKHMEKAEQYYEGMKREYEKGGYNNCVTMAVHSAISWVDALTIFRLGRKSSAQNHAEMINLLKEARTSDEAKKSRICDKLYELVELKTPAEYEDRLMSKADAEKAKQLCEKIRGFLKYELGRAEVFSEP